MKKYLLFLWQLPQNLIGYILLLFYKQNKIREHKGYKIRVCNGFPGGVSLGEVIILKRYPNTQSTWDDANHEIGHALQSKDWGWLYLLVIGLPSGLFNLYDRWFHDNDIKWFKWYYNLPWEKDADKRGGVVRNYE